MEKAFNAVTGYIYQGTNAATLGTGTWATFLQWKSLGRKIKKGQKGTSIIKFLENIVEVNVPGKPASKKEKTGFRYYTVFEKGQTECAGVHPTIKDLAECNECEYLFANTKAI